MIIMLMQCNDDSSGRHNAVQQITFKVNDLLHLIVLCGGVLWLCYVGGD